MQEAHPIPSEVVEPESSPQKKERALPVSILVQSVVESFSFVKEFSFNDVIMIINGTTSFYVKDVVAGKGGIRSSLRNMACISRTPIGIKPAVLKREAPCKEICSTCSRMKSGSFGCIINDPSVRESYFPEEEGRKSS